MILTREQVVKKARNLYEQVIAAMAGDTPPYRDEGESIARFNFIEGYCAGHEDALAAAEEREKVLVEALAAARLGYRGLCGLDDPSYPQARQTFGETLQQIDAALGLGQREREGEP